MGTRCITQVYKMEDGLAVMCMYRQCDGYKQGHGLELAKFITARTVINGIQDQTARTHANGMDCLAAQIVVHFKKGDIGHIYLQPVVENPAYWQEYEYHVYPERVRVVRLGKELFNGTWGGFLVWCETPDYED